MCCRASATRTAPERTLLQDSSCVSVLNNVLSNNNILSGNCIQVSQVGVNLLSGVLGKQVQHGYACPANAQTAPADVSGGNNCQCQILSFNGVNVQVLSGIFNLLGLQGNQLFYNCNQ